MTAFYFSDGKLSQAQSKIFRRSFIGETKGNYECVKCNYSISSRVNKPVA